jgi:hypothetical protein
MRRRYRPASLPSSSANSPETTLAGKPACAARSRALPNGRQRQVLLLGQAVQSDKLKPRHITELHERDERLADLHIPPAIRHDVYAIRAHGFHVNVVGDVIVATAPDGQVVQVPLSSLEGKFGPVLGRQKLLEDLQKIRHPVHPGPKGEPHVDP